MKHFNNRAGIFGLFFREIARIASDHSLLLTLILAPLFYAFFYGSIYINKEEEEIQLAIVDDDNSNLSRLLAQQIDHSQIVKLIQYPNLSEAKEHMYQGKCQGYFYIPKGVEGRLLTLKQANVFLAVNAARFLPSSDLLATVQQICLTIGGGVRLQYFEKVKGLNTQEAMEQVAPIGLDYRPLFNERSSYGAFLLPGLLALILQQTLLIGLAESVASERQENTWLNWTANGISSAIWGKGLFYLILYMAYAFFFLTINFHLLKIPIRGNGFDLTLILGLFIATLIPMAQCIGSIFTTQLTCLQVMAFSTYPIFLISGYTWPLKSLPLALQWLSSLLPTTPFLKIYGSIVQSGASIAENIPALLHLTILFCFYSFLAYFRIYRVRKKSIQ